MATQLPKKIFSGYWKGGHCQGIAVDAEHQRIFYSFTTELIVTDLQGNLLGSVTGLLGHLGCIDYNEKDGRLYGSLEYKNDAIGKSILKNLGSDATLEDAFYIAIFDVDRIDRVGMDACESGVMTAVYLKTVVDDFNAVVSCGGREFRHRLGCSGIDGTAFGPMPGSADRKQYLFVAYGVYSENDRTDNDYQVILCYDTGDWSQYEQTLVQTSMHKSGPAAPHKKLFVRTGNTNYGVQNLEYDAYTNTFLMAVYRGTKENWPNYSLFSIDASKPPVTETLLGVEPETEGEVLQLAELGLKDEQTGIRGWHVGHSHNGTTGLYAFGDGTYYISFDGRDEQGWYTNVTLCTWDEKNAFVPAE